MNNEGNNKNTLKDFFEILRKSVLARFITVILCLSFLAVLTYLITISIPIILGFLRGNLDDKKDLIIDKNIEDYEDDPQEKDPSQNEEIDFESIKVMCHESIPVKADSEDIDISLVNPEDNNCYFIISIFLMNAEKNEYEELFKSNMIPPGKCLNRIKLHKALSTGTHIAFIRYEAFAMDTLLPLNILESEIRLLAS